MAERRLVLVGEIDIARVGDLRADLRRLIEGSDAHLLIDCARMTFIDSAGIVAMLEANVRLAEQDRHMLIANVQPRLRRTFEIFGVAELLTYDRIPSHCARRNGRPIRAPIL